MKNRLMHTTSVFVTVILPLITGTSSAQPPVILDFTAPGRITWAAASTDSVSVVEFTAKPEADPWVSLHAGRTASLTSSVEVALADPAAWYRVTASATTGEPPGMVLVPGGAFAMGDGQGTGDPDELPVHTVTLDPFYIDRYEATNDEVRDDLQWAYDLGRVLVTASAVYNASGTVHQLLDIGDADCRITWDAGSETFGVAALKGEGYPCVEVTWYGACALANYRSEQAGLDPCFGMGNGVSVWTCDWTANGYRLPTEAEWEKAARGGALGLNFEGFAPDTVAHTRANFYSYWSNGVPFYVYDVSPQAGHHPDYISALVPVYTSPVGSFDANPFGAYDLVGNVLEWCWDTYDGGYYAVAPDTNPRGPAWGNLKVGRGGSWNSNAAGCRVADRSAGTAAGSSAFAGFRLVRNVE